MPGPRRAESGHYSANASVLHLPRSLVSIAHELSGLGSARVVRFSASGWRRIDEPGDVATRPQNAEVSGRFEPLGAARAIDDGGRGVAGHVGAPVPTLPGAVRAGRRCRSARPAVGQALAATHRSGRDRADAGALPDDVSRLERDAFPRARGARSQVCVGLHLDQGAAACRRAGGAGKTARGTSAQAGEEAMRGHAAAPGWLAAYLAG